MHLQANPDTSAQPNPPNWKRREPRLPVDIGAVLHLIDLAAHMQGRILDISLGGCRLRTSERFLLGIYRRIETEFRVDGIPFRLAGGTQAIYDRHTIGIRFLNMSERKREQLVQLMRDIRADQDPDHDPGQAPDHQRDHDPGQYPDALAPAGHAPDQQLAGQILLRPVATSGTQSPTATSPAVSS